MKKIAITSILILLLGISVKSETAVVSGKIINGKGLTLRLMTFSDHVSYLRETLESAVIGDDEGFSFAIDVDSVKYCWLDIEFQQAEIFIQPGQSYEVEIELKNLSLSDSYYNRTGLPIRILKDDEDHLNLSIQDFNQLYNDFLLNYAENIRARSSKAAYDTFIKAINLRFQQSTNLYFKNYIRYKSASMQLFMRLKSRDKLGLEFFTGQPILYEHLEYMDFFHLYFEKYFLMGGKHFDYNKTFDLVNGKTSSLAILDSMKADPVLQDMGLRELLLLDGLKELYSAPGFKRDRILLLVNEIAQKGSLPQNRKLAENLLLRLKRLQPGSPAPEFRLTAVGDKQQYQLDDFSGKYLYLAFFNSGNPACQSELGLVTDFYEKYKNIVAFVAVSTDKDPALLEAYLNKAGLPWLVLHYGGDLDLLESYDASTYPHFLLIDDKSRILRCPAPSPSENIQKLFDSFK
jgi:thiol-disulfide isomerase/thioredoxin